MTTEITIDPALASGGAGPQTPADNKPEGQQVWQPPFVMPENAPYLASQKELGLYPNNDLAKPLVWEEPSQGAVNNTVAENKSSLAQLSEKWWGPAEEQASKGIVADHQERIWGQEDRSDPAYHLHTTSTPEQQVAALGKQADTLLQTLPNDTFHQNVAEDVQVAQRTGNLDALLKAVPTLAFFQNTGMGVTGMGEDISTEMLGHMSAMSTPVTAAALEAKALANESSPSLACS